MTWWMWLYPWLVVSIALGFIAWFGRKKTGADVELPTQNVKPPQPQKAVVTTFEIIRLLEKILSRETVAVSTLVWIDNMETGTVGCWVFLLTNEGVVESKLRLTWLCNVAYEDQMLRVSALLREWIVEFHKLRKIARAVKAGNG